MEILFLTHRIPYPPNKGDKIRSHAMISHLAKRHRVHLACFVDDPRDFEHVDHVRRMVGGECLFVPLKPVTKWIGAASALATGQSITTAYFGSRAITQWVKSLVQTRPIDRTIVFSTAMAPYILDGSGFDPALTLFDMLDVDSDKWRQYAEPASPAERWIFRREARKLLQLERAAAAEFGITTVVSEYEAASFAEMAPESRKRIRALGNGVELQIDKNSFSNPFAPDEIPIVMTGWMDYRPNSDGAAWFATEIMPQIARSLPRARFHIVGANPGASLRKVVGSRTVFSGRVDDVRPYLRHAAAVVAPLRIARGVQNKVLEAMAMQKPVIATEEATRALSVTSEIELWIENDPLRFAAAVIAATAGENSERVARNGRKYVERHHDWNQILSTLDEILACLEKRTEGDKRPRPLTAAAGSQQRNRQRLETNKESHADARP